MSEKLNNFIDKVSNCVSYLTEIILPKALMIIMILGYIIINFIGSNKIISSVDNSLKFMFATNRMSMLSTISVVLIGIYITVVSVFGSSQSVAIVKISKADLGGKFISYAELALISSFIHFIITIFYYESTLFLYIYSIIFVWMITSFIRFVTVIFKMYKDNINSFAKIIEDDEREKREFRNKFFIMYNEIEKLSKKENNNNANKVQSINEFQRKDK